MTDQLPDLTSLIAAIDSGHELTIERLHAASGIAAGLTDRAEQLLDHYVAAARAEGRSWTEISAAFGTTRQAAQQRFGGRRGQARLAGAAGAVVAAALGEASRLGSSHVGTEHLLLGLLSVPDTSTARTLQARGVTEERVRERLAALVPAPPTPYAGDGHVPFGPRVKKVQEIAFRHAKSERRDEFDERDILAAIVIEGQGLAARILVDLGVPLKQLRKDL